MNVHSGDQNAPYFTQRWFYQMKNDEIWQKHLRSYEGKPFRYLEVGSFEGMSVHWIATNYPLAELTCIDTFKGSGEHLGISGLEERFDHNMRPFTDRVTKIVGMSGDKLKELSKENYDIIYIDGDHHAQQVLEDAVLTFPLLKAGGLLIFDDYEWRPQEAYTQYDCPKLGIVAFLTLYRGHYDVEHKEYQVIIKKKEYDLKDTVGELRTFK